MTRQRNPDASHRTQDVGHTWTVQYVSVRKDWTGAWNRVDSPRSRSFARALGWPSLSMSRRFRPPSFGLIETGRAPGSPMVALFFWTLGPVHSASQLRMWWSGGNDRGPMAPPANFTSLAAKPRRTSTGT